MDDSRLTSCTSDASCWDSSEKAAESGGPRIFKRASMADTLRRIEWSRGRGCCASGAALIGRDGSERYDAGSESMYARRSMIRRLSMRIAFILAVREERTGQRLACLYQIKFAAAEPTLFVVCIQDDRLIDGRVLFFLLLLLLLLPSCIPLPSNLIVS